MSPEQAEGDLEHLGPALDVYSLGGTLYCLLTGRPPFEGDDFGEVLRAVQRGEFSPPRQLDPTIDQALEAVCLKAMATAGGTLRRRPGRCRGRRAVDGRRAGLRLARAVVAAGAAVGEAKLDGDDRRRGGTARRRVRAVGGAGRADAGQGASAGADAAKRARAEPLRAAVQARYDLAVNAIKTFHTGVSEDFLLKEESSRHCATGS